MIILTQTDHLALPFILASQAQKHVTHNEALLALDAIVQLHVMSRNLTDGPANPAIGARYIVPETPTGQFIGQTGKLAALQDGIYQFYTPKTGWLAYISDENIHVFFDGTDWQLLGNVGGEVLFSHLGINATPDDINRLSLASDASLFNHAGNGHQLKINKSLHTDTASLLFQTGFSGRAEFGLSGDDQFRIKTSHDGSNFNIALTADAATGFVAIGDISPSANLTVANQLEIADPATASAVFISATPTKSSLSSTTADADLDISQSGDGTINFKINGTEVLSLNDGQIFAKAPVQLPQFSKSSLPNAANFGEAIFIPDAIGGSCIAFSDGSNWRRSEDRSVVSA